LRTAPISRTQILLGKGLACFIATVGVAALLLIVAAIVFGVRPSAPAKLVMAVVSVSLCFVGVMMLLSVIGKTEQSAGGIGWAILMVMAMIGGGMVPLMFLPGWLQDIASVSPVKWSILALEGAIWRDFSYAELAGPCGVLVGMGAVCFVVGTRAFRWSA
ncbi:MAG: ABC transporter permease, partial [Phycisphaerales bacterium]|nr:ABC transporter permease [Phycisphaerales bacterium]